MTTEDKLYIEGGLLLAAAGITWFLVKKPKSDTIDISHEEIKDETPEIPTSATPPIKVIAPPKVIAPKPEVTPDSFKYEIGQEVMSNVRTGTQTQNVKKKADGQYFTDGKNIAKFNYGDKIGKIIWAGKRSDTGEYKYVVERKGQWLTSLYWVSHKTIAPIGKVIAPKVILNTNGLVLNRMLHKGIYNSKEVFELQRRLGFAKPDGDFGDDTEKALLAKKKVKQIRLADWK